LLIEKFSAFHILGYDFHDITNYDLERLRPILQ
jgi:hypothetical protein